MLARPVDGITLLFVVLVPAVILVALMQSNKSDDSLHQQSLTTSDREFLHDLLRCYDPKESW